MANRFQAFKFGHDIWDPSNRFETSWLLRPWVLFAIRASISLYAFVVLIFNIAWDLATIHDGGKTARFEFSYFTSNPSYESLFISSSH